MAYGDKIYSLSRLEYEYYYAASIRALNRNCTQARVINDIIFGIDVPLIRELEDARYLMFKYKRTNFKIHMNVRVNRSVWDAAFNLRLLRLNYKVKKRLLIHKILDGSENNLSEELKAVMKEHEYKRLLKDLGVDDLGTMALARQREVKAASLEERSSLQEGSLR